MHVVVTHVTRMQPGFVCVAGQRVGDDASIRPVTPGARLSRSVTELEGGPFWIGNRVDLGPALPCGVEPEVEDHSFQPFRARLISRESPETLWALLERCARSRFSDVFGPTLAANGWTAALPEGKGKASLGILRPQERPSLSVFDGKAVRLGVHDGEQQFSIAVTDIRLYRADGALDHQALAALASKLHREHCFLAVGVGRPWQKDGDSFPRHWLQINGIHFPSGPSWS